MKSGTMRILVVEDDTRMLELLCRGMRDAGHAIMPASDGRTALELASGIDFDALVLDVGLPYGDGFAVTQALRSQNFSAGILILTARDTEDDVVHGLELGADDYMIKPFSFPELLARLQALRRPATSREACHPLSLDAVRLTALRSHLVIQLTRTEFLLLKSLSQANGKTVPRRQLMEYIWGEESLVPPNSLDVLVNGLRSKVDAPFASKLIATVRGIGYRLLDESLADCPQVAQ